MGKGAFKKGAVIATISLGIIALTYMFVPPVKDFVDEKIFNNPPSVTQNLTEAQAVSNIAFDEESRTLTFNASADGVSYVIDVVNVTNNNSTQYESPVNTLQVEIPQNSLSGHTIIFIIVAKGDKVTTRDSKSVEYEYVLQHETELLYGQLQEDVFAYFNYYLNSETPISGATISNFDIMEVQGTNLIVRGSGQSEYGRPFTFRLQFDVSNYLNIISQDFDNLTEFSNLMSGITEIDSRKIQVSYQYTDNYFDLSNGLIESNSTVFQNYIAQGYTISTLQQTTSAVYDANETTKAFTVTGIYQAFNATTGNIITFEISQEVQVPMQEGFTNTQYLQQFNQTGEGTVLDGEAKIFDANMMNHVNIMNQLRNATSQQAAQEEGMQQ